MFITVYECCPPSSVPPGSVTTSTSSLISESSSSQSSPASESLSRKSSSQSSITLSQQGSPPRHSPKPTGLKKRRRHKYIPIQYHYIISPTAETVQPPLKQEQALKAILEECQIVVECVPNYPGSYTNNFDRYSCWESSPSDTQGSWRESDSGGLLDCISATTTCSPFTEQNYNSHLYTFPTTATTSAAAEYTMFSAGAQPGMMSCGQMEGDFPQLSQHSAVSSHYNQAPLSNSTAYGTCGPAGLQPTDYLCQGMDYR